MPERFAVYFAPVRESDLGRFGSQWVGRCARTGLPVEQPALPGLSRDQLRELTSAPRHYGFHATLVPPFALRESCSADNFLTRVHAVAGELHPFDLPLLTIREIGNFIALVPARQEAVAALAETCLRALGAFREPPSLAELERQRSRGLTPTQERLLADWGYPYVLGEYLFHLTLTGPVRDKARRKTLLRRLAEFTEPLRKAAHPVRDICVFHQEFTEAPFFLTHRVPLGRDRR
ncbi:MAG: DUF1045 domain-containing protein [Pseudodesulfovibrio sp.]|uniref:Phosphonate metabolism protein n=1 Tax=Pseudodesulfovibrio aespoeensis (strain ATCC 700646 / DSM 10631 / Aspo-2) TaxID=643562 RepID=E6VTJ8_PSEA9|nr:MULTISPECIES: DUF1045 domain-containing protein [Pseudodesulfovibrio]MBU4191053.1 DUF1045 domain-containing protein [Pseudomonadota bacterium]ADU62175.1 protein of unknown function DUF1045 [Pseudodesulfovibrio aespoeensis Aspo-2]MBU4244776.1 DUF1045 domain-containing protein [Pseudomonadota bacterium]MBU4377662.1 DUF1045 domain-containing protein [Pseudomonadota bacterium]MBU4476136.1 DUF1045 domain-containing protein [Pseudomonadota bacterium]